MLIIHHKTFFLQNNSVELYICKPIQIKVRSNEDRFTLLEFMNRISDFIDVSCISPFLFQM
ncbi:unnamed protein product [Haemonchus placei]|uniref:Uncharacterized protein n=1 Tax=Haemonchus placei TaxID=6290 RepID=A0A0N4VXP5_HAEPC|nr:unnamed protein product [Haemonchus placei]